MSPVPDHGPQLDFAGELHALRPGRPLSVGRAGDVVVDEDNPFLHRTFLVLTAGAGTVWVENVGTQLSAMVSDEDGLTETWLSPGARALLVGGRNSIVFSAGPTTYELVVTVPEAATPAPTDLPAGAGLADPTVLPVTLTPDQRLLCVVLSEPFLRRSAGAGRGQVPATAAAAARLGWTVTKFNRKLDNVCEKLARTGVRGLTPQPGVPASGRRTRLVDHVLSTRLVTHADLALLDPPTGP